MGEISRREFIRISSCALGGVILVGCSDSGNGGSGGGRTIPNGYYFYRLKTSGQQVGTGSRSLSIYDFGGSAHISESGVFTFDAIDVNGRQGLFQLHVDLAGRLPAILDERTSIISGDVLGDGREVQKCLRHDVNNQGNIAAVVRPANNSEKHYGSGLYLNISESGFERILGSGDSFHQGLYESTGILGDVSLREGNSLLFEANHLTGAAPKSSIFHLPGASLSSSKQMMSTGDYINGTDQYLTGFGIIDHIADSHFSVTVSHQYSGLLGVEQGTASSAVNSLLTGYISNPGDHLLLSAGPEISTADHTANVHYGPRIGPDGTVYSKIADEFKESLIAGSEVIKTTDGVTREGYKVDSFTPGCVGPDGIFYYTEYAETDKALHTALYAYDGTDHKVILSTGNTLSDGGAPVKNILFSTTTHHVGDDGIITLVCEFEDNSSALIVGIPI